MKKEGLLFAVIVFLILLSFSIFAQENEKVKKAYDCLENKVKDKCKDLSVEEQAFTVLATGKCSSELQGSSKNDECWPSSGCRLRDTALAILALNRVGKDTEKAEDWLLSQTTVPTELTWYLEIDADEETSCTINYGNTEKEITIKEDKKINKGAGTCLSLAEGGYWLKIDDSCYGTNFTISCNKDFITTLLYKKKTGATVYVSSQTNSAPSEGKTEESVDALCFGKSCDYEGSLWASLALAETDYDVSSFLPYLIAMVEDNEKYFPSAFLYIITDYDDYFTQIIDEQKDDYWKIANSPYHQFYDTSLALLALQGLDAEQASSAKDYLLEVQGGDGCWNSVRDTAFILYAAFPKDVSKAEPKLDYCEDFNYYCVSSFDCSAEDKVDLLCSYGLGKICCKRKPAEKTCDEKNGIICRTDQQCTGSLVPASDTTDCCLGSCIAKVPEKTECEEQNYNCRYSCLDDEEAKIYDCEAGKTCCAPAPPPSPSYWWLWLLIILIILVALGIIFKNRLRVFIYKLKSRGRGPQPAPTARRGFPPAPPSVMLRPRPRMIMPRPPIRPIPRGPSAPIRKATSKTDKELEETLKKLKEMSK